MFVTSTHALTNAADTQFEFDLLVGRLLRKGVAAKSALLYGAPEHVISERAHAMNANYVMFGLHKEGTFLPQKSGGRCHQERSLRDLHLRPTG